jgi:hypothetical protein
VVITKCCDFVLAVDNVKSDRSQFTFRVWASPAGESHVAEFVWLPTSLQRKERQLDIAILCKLMNTGDRATTPEEYRQKV